MGRKRKPKEYEDIMLKELPDRRLLAHVPDPTGQRTQGDRRDDLEGDADKPQSARFAGKRYSASIAVKVRSGKKKMSARSVDISQTGMQLKTNGGTQDLNVGDTVRLRFNLLPGILQEGMEKRYAIQAHVVRVLDEERFAVQFQEPLYRNRHHTKDTYLLTLSSACLMLVALCILLMRVESVVFFTQNWLLYGYSILTAFYLLSRYAFGMLYKPTPVDPSFTPGVTIVIPCFNEATWIRRTILSCIDQDYPADKLELIIVNTSFLLTFPQGEGIQ